MSRVLLIGPYRQKDGWGKACREYIRATALTNNEFTIRPIYMSHQIQEDIDSDLVSHEKTALSGRPDVVIQNALPHYYDYQHGAKNIGIAYFETANFMQIGWTHHINLMDEMWVSSEHEKRTLLKAGVKIPVKVIPMPIDMKWLDKDVKPLEIPQADDYYKFYYIGEFITRKNLAALIIAFHREFRSFERVKLVIKTSKLLKTPEEISVLLQKLITEIKSNMRLYMNQDSYMAEFIITDYLSGDELLGLHKACDCLVLPSRGESLSRPVMEAMYCGNDVIVTGNTAMSELTGLGGFHIDSIETPVYVTDPPLEQLYTGWETWQEPSIISLQKCMRAAFESTQEDREYRKELNKERMANFTHEKVALRIAECL